MSRAKLKLPNKILTFGGNAEKVKWQEHWYPGRDLLNFPKSHRIILAAKPNSGKSTICRNLILRADPPFEKIIVVHPNWEKTKEYDYLFEGLDEDQDMVQIRGDIPSLDEFTDLVGEDVERPKPMLVILDDIEFKSLSKKQQQSFHYLMNHISSHQNVSVYVTAQDLFNLPLTVRRTSNVFVIFNQPDKQSMDALYRRVGITGKKVTTIFETHLT